MIPCFGESCWLSFSPADLLFETLSLWVPGVSKVILIFNECQKNFYIIVACNWLFMYTLHQMYDLRINKNFKNKGMLEEGIQ